MNSFIYKGQNTKEISFPLGGIGTGCIGLAGNGRLIDWEIYNKPNKGSVNCFSHFAIKAESEGKTIDARVLNGDLQPPYMGGSDNSKYSGFGFGPGRHTMAGVPHFEEVEFQGEYPFATLNFKDENFPAKINMKAFNPLIPINDKDSSIPAAFFEFEVENTADKIIDYSVAFSVGNPINKCSVINTYSNEKNVHLLKLSSDNKDENDLDFGDLTIACDADEISYQEYWYRGRWFDSLGIFWNEFILPGKLKNRSYKQTDKENSHHQGASDMGTLISHFSLKPHERTVVKYVLTWSFPNNTNYWKPMKEEAEVVSAETTESIVAAETTESIAAATAAEATAPSQECGCNCKCNSKNIKPNKNWKNYYASLFKSSSESAIYCFNNWDRLYKETMLFKEALFSSTLPEYVIDAVSANISILKSPTCLRLEDGSFYGFEGCHCNGGCCEGSCTHVWNYAYALPFLFPKLERSMRDLDYKYNMREDGGMGFRLQLPLGRERSGFRPCADGQFGGVLKVYRDWKISGDTQWLEKNWSAVKKSLEYAWAPTNEDRWDFDKDGVLEGRQHHTLDMELFGPNSWLTGFYLAALKAGAEMAKYLGDNEHASLYLSLFNNGKKWVDKNLFNGEFYHQNIDLKDKTIIDKFDKSFNSSGDEALKSYWNDEAEEVKYQVGEGCGIDQVVAQWHSNICGLGEIFDKGQTKKALESIYKYNYKRSMRKFFNPCRLYSLNNEAGVVICDWPENKYKPVVPIPYAEETMYGFEYQAAIHMIQEGLVEEGLNIVKDIRKRFDGEKRNPWNEFECGSNYARSMASYSLLNALSGFEFDMVKGMIGFNAVDTKNFKCFWSLDSGWGMFEISNNFVIIKVLYGKLKLRTIKLPFLSSINIQGIKIGDNEQIFTKSEGWIEFAEDVTIETGINLVIK